MIMGPKKQSILIYNARSLSDDKIVPKTWILIENKKIKKIGQGKNPNFITDLTINANNNHISSGFIDLHIHGQIEKISEQQAKSGTTGFLLGLHAGQFKHFAEKIKQTSRISLKAARCLGYHLEGPFINKDMAGAQPKEHIQPPDIPAVRSLLSQVPGLVKIITFACELKKSDEFIKLLKKHRVVPALGHSNASFEQAQKAVDLGACYATHTFNRMSGISSRNPGLSTQVLLNNDLSAEIIADGHHVHPALIKLLVKTKPANKIVLVTDSIAAMDKTSLNMIAGVYRMEDYTIAGSKLTMLQAVKNMVYLTNIQLQIAVKMATENPARILGLAGRKGRIRPGFDADLVIFDKDFKCLMTIVEGNIVYNNLS
jgi:N-acetylglucosamine-6-phosphate deacetylase